MAPRSNFMADIAQMANGAASAFGGMREEVDNLIRQRMERSLNARGLVTREEFDALRTRHEALAARLAFLESTMASPAESAGKAATAAKPAAKAKSAAKKTENNQRFEPAANQRKRRRKTQFHVGHACLSHKILY